VRTVVIPPPGVFGFGRSRTVAVVARPLTGVEANAIGVALNQRHIPVAVSVDACHVIHLWPWLPLTTTDEVRAMRAFAAVTDAPLRWHPAVGG
jgi:hypothetical protein